MAEDPIVNEANVYLTHALARQLCILQYPLRPAHLPTPAHDIPCARVRMKHRELDLDIAITPAGENYSESRGEQYGKTTDVKGQPYYKSGRFDKHTLKSEPVVADMSRYVVGVFKDGELYLAPLYAVLKLKPSLTHLNHYDDKKQTVVGGTLSGGETENEEEEEEAQPVQVKLKQSGKTAAQGPVKEEEPWLSLDLYSLESEAATEERALLFSAYEDQTGIFQLGNNQYLDITCPVDSAEAFYAPVVAGGLLTIDQLKTLPLHQQVKELFKSSVVLQYGQVHTLLNGESQATVLLDLVQKCAVLVQGCWVASSELMYPDETDHSYKSSRDYILMSFAKNRILLRKDVTSTIKIPHEDMLDILRSVAIQRISVGWEFKLPFDSDFCQSFPEVVSQQEHRWRLREKELIKELVPRQDSGKLFPSSSIQVHAVSGDDIVKLAAKKIRPLPLDSLGNSMATPAITEALKNFCHTSLGVGVMGLSELKDKLLLRQATSLDSDPLRGYGIPDTLLESTLTEVGAIQVGQTGGKQLYAVVAPTSDSSINEYRKIILKLFQTSKNIRKKQVLDELSKLGIEPDQKALSSVFKDLCYSKGSSWSLFGT